MIVRCREGVKKAIDFDEVAQGLNKRIIIQQAVFQVSFSRKDIYFQLHVFWKKKSTASDPFHFDTAPDPRIRFVENRSITGSDIK